MSLNPSTAFEAQVSVANRFVRTFAAIDDPYTSFPVLDLLMSAAEVKSGVARNHALDAISAEIGVEPLPESLKEKFGAIDEPKVCGPAMMERLTFLFFRLNNPEKPGETYVVGLGRQLGNPKLTAICQTVPTAVLATDGFMPLMRKAYDAAKPA